MNDIQKFNFNGTSLRVIMENNQPLFHANDFCERLGYATPRDAIARHCKADGVVKRDVIDSLGRTQEANFINESNLYRLIMRSNMPDAEEFQDWVTKEVLPCIRQTGAYITDKAAKELLDDPSVFLDKLIQSASMAKELHKKNLEQKKIIEAQTPIVKAAELFLDSDSITEITAIAKQLNTSAVALNKFLNEQKVIYRIGQIGAWVLYEKYVNMGLGKLITHSFHKSDGSIGTKELWKWNEKGRQFIIQLWQDNKK